MKLLCLANSWKEGKRCLAGVKWPELDVWIRPISTDIEGGAVPTNRCRHVKLLDLIEIEISEVVNTVVYQPENMALGESEIKRIRNLPIDEVRTDLFRLSNYPERLLGSHVRNNISESEANLGLSSSIKLIRAKCRFHQDDRNKWRAEFNLNRFGQIDERKTYDLPLTDPDWTQRCNADPDWAGMNRDIFLTVSIGNEFRGSHWFLVSGVLEVFPRVL